MKKVLSFVCALFVFSMIGCSAPSVEEATTLEDLGNGQYMVDFTDKRESIKLPEVIKTYTAQGYKVVAISGAESHRGSSVVILTK